MNIIDAIKSGRPFRRCAWQCNWSDPGGGTQVFCITDILADDYEIQEPSVTVTKSVFYKTVASVLKDRAPPEYRHEVMSAYADFVAALAGQLGFSDAT